MKKIALTLICLCFSQAVHSADLVVQSARDHIDVTVGFVGSTIEIFGDRRDPKADVAIVVEGPKENITLWKKGRVLGAWMNTSYVSYEDVPAYYHFATSLDKTDKNTPDILRKSGIGYDALFDIVPTKASDPKNLEDFRQALETKKKKKKVYFKESGAINFLNDNFFRARFIIPPSVPTGEYRIHSYLIKDGVIKEHEFDVFKVQQVGLNAFVYEAAQKHSTIYALLCIFLAVFAGWLMSVLKVKP